MQSKSKIFAIISCLTVSITGINTADAGQGISIPLPFTYDFDMDPSRSSCTNTSTTVELRGPLSVTRGRPVVMVRFKQNERRDGLFLSEATADVSPTQGTITANKKAIGGMGNPYISFNDANSNTLGQLGRCVTPSSKSVYNRLRDRGNGTGLLSVALSAGSCSTKGSTVNLNTTALGGGIDGDIFLTNQLIGSASEYADSAHGTSGAGKLTVRLLDPINEQRKGTPSGVGGNPFVSMQIADCSAHKKLDGTVDLPACKSAIQNQVRDAVNAASVSANPEETFASYFPYDLNGQRRNDGKSLSDFGPALIPETTPVRCNKL